MKFLIDAKLDDFKLRFTEIKHVFTNNRSLQQYKLNEFMQLG